MLLRINRSIKNINYAKAVCLSCRVRLLDEMHIEAQEKCILVENDISECNMSV